uniref:MlrA-like transcription regulator n=1 Tax=uncultured bacterium CSLF42 TaxID=1091574 RepID=G4WVY1_9BACT|nr:MlrA-like transcription regulator [uncultured bacterium CSLF42]
MNVMLEALLPPQTYFSISEVSQATQVKPYVIRYWESQFGALRPARRESGQRKFTQKEIDIILRIKELLYDKGFTISGAKRFLKQEARKGSAQLKLDLGENAETAQPLETLRNVRKDLEDALRLLKS